jgi:hypothetical protein
LGHFHQSLLLLAGPIDSGCPGELVQDCPIPYCRFHFAEPILPTFVKNDKISSYYFLFKKKY